MHLRFSEEDEAFRREFAEWLGDSRRGEFEVLRGRGGPGDENAFFDERAAWEKVMGAAGWTCISWPSEKKPYSGIRVGDRGHCLQ